MEICISLSLLNYNFVYTNLCQSIITQIQNMWVEMTVSGSSNHLESVSVRKCYVKKIQE